MSNRDCNSGIEIRLDVCGGEPCVANTRIPVWVLEQARRLGTSDSDLLRTYPILRAEDLIHAWTYAKAHTVEIDCQIVANEQA